MKKATKITEDSSILERKKFDSNKPEYFKKIFELVPNPILVADRDGIYCYVNESACEFFDCKFEEIIGKNILDIIQPKDAERLAEHKKRLFAGSEESNDWEFKRKDGTFVWGEVHTRVIDDEFCVAFIYDITETRKVQEKIKESEDRYKAFIEQSSEGIWRLELETPISIKLPLNEQIDLLYKNGYVAECNNAMAKQFGFKEPSDLVGKPLDYFLKRDNEEHYNYLRAFIESGYNQINKETTEKDKNGNDRYFVNNLLGNIEDKYLVRLWGTKQDITAAKETELAYLESEEKQRQSGKVEAIGRLAGGVAHDFNNFLAVIMLHVDMLRLQLAPDSPLRFRIDEIKTVTDSAATMVRQLLAFGRKQTLQPNPVILNQVVKEFTKILGSLIGEDIQDQTQSRTRFRRLFC